MGGDLAHARCAAGACSTHGGLAGVSVIDGDCLTPAKPTMQASLRVHRCAAQVGEHWCTDTPFSACRGCLTLVHHLILYFIAVTCVTALDDGAQSVSFLGWRLVGPASVPNTCLAAVATQLTPTSTACSTRLLCFYMHIPSRYGTATTTQTSVLALFYPTPHPCRHHVSVAHPPA
jgi:hypothetical protein